MQHDQCGEYKVYFSLIQLRGIKESATSMDILYKSLHGSLINFKVCYKNMFGESSVL
jgi:hypothetical protein